jgi:hypothetical protein
MGLLRVLSVGLLLVSHLRLSAIPPKALDLMQRDAIAISLSAYIRDRIFEPSKNTEPFYEYWAFNIQIRERAVERFRLRYRYLCDSVFWRKEKHHLRYLARLAWRYGTHAGFIQKFVRSVLGRSLAK